MTEEVALSDEWEAPNKLFSKLIVKTGRVDKRPVHEASCQINVLSDEQGVIGLPEGVKSKVLVIGHVASEVELILEGCLMTMNVGEVCDLLFSLPLNVTVPYTPKATYLCDDSQQVDLAGSSRGPSECKNGDADVPENSRVPSEQPAVVTKSYRVRLELESFENVPFVCDMAVADKWRYACMHKDEGSSLFSVKNYRWAFRHFSWAYKYVVSLEHDEVPEDVAAELQIDVQGLKLKCLLNLAACQLHNYSYDYVVENCSLALEIDPSNVKALYRRGSALVQLQEYERAKCDLEQAKLLDPKNASIDKQLELVRERTCKLNKFFAVAMKKLFE